MFKFIIHMAFFLPLFSESIIADRKPIGNFISPDAFRGVCDFIYEGGTVECWNTIPKIPSPLSFKKKIKQKIRPGDTIYVSVQCLDHFIQHVHPNIPYPYFLVCSSDDFPVFDENYLDFINDPKVIKCFVRNINIDHEKVQPIPIGITNYFWWRYYYHEDINIILESVKYKIKRNEKVLLNINIGTFNEERSCVFNLFNGQSFIKSIGRTDLRTYWKTLKENKFVLSPSGNGIECHRTWEAMYMGSIPIICPTAKHPYRQPAKGYEKLYHDLPVIMVKNWEEVTEEFLQQKLEEFKDRKFNMDKLYFPYWKNLLMKESQDFKKSYRNNRIH